MRHLVVTNKFELGMIEETCCFPTGLAISMPERQDVINLLKEFKEKDNRRLHIHFQNRGTYESSHEGFYFRKAIAHLSYPEKFYIDNSPFPFNSHIFTNDDHIMILQNCYDPVFSEDEFSYDFIKAYLISF